MQRIVELPSTPRLAVSAPEAAAKVERGLARALSIGAAVVLAIGAFAIMLWLTSDPIRREIVEGVIRSPFGLLALFGLAALSTATLILPAPGLALTAIAGAAGDPFVVGVVAGLGQAVGELTGYAAGSSGGSFVPDGAAQSPVTGWLRRRGVLVIFLLAVFPNPVFDLAGVAAGVLRMPVLHYLVAAACGKVIKNVAIAGGASMIGTLMATIATSSA
jgi:uncharacterized membrane protein YdjX (TVP38/TMEM64 family)